MIGWAGAAALAAITLLLWPDAPRSAAITAASRAGSADPAGWRTRLRLEAVRQRWRGRRPGVRRAGRRRRLPVLAGGAGFAVAASRLAPWPVAIAGVLACCTATSLVRHARDTARARRELAGLTTTLRGVVRELHAGATPRAAVDHATADAPPVTRLLLEALAPRVSASRDAALRLPSTAVTDAVVDQLRRAWAVSERHGVPLAAVLSACVADLDDRAALARLRAQQVAGPAVSGYVLAALPAAGLAMGAGMGSHPVDVLTGSTLGGALLVAGVTLCCAGLLWSGRIVRGGRHD